MNLKKTTTFEEQVELLRKKNIIITDKDSYIDFLSKTNYYRLTGYYLPFIRKQDENALLNWIISVFKIFMLLMWN